MSDLLTPLCPLCNEPPALVFGRQAFCGTEDCPTFTWDRTLPLDILLMSATEAKITERRPDDADPD